MLLAMIIKMRMLQVVSVALIMWVELATKMHLTYKSGGLGCSTNFAEIQSPDGNALLEVELQRAQQSNVNCNQSNSCTWNDFNEIITCSTITFCAAVNEYFDPNKIPFPAKTWETNMLYAPNQMVRVRVETDCPGTAACWYQSSWH